DVRDPATVTRVAEAVGDVGTLQLLVALTEADGRATGRTAWRTWKAGLVDELVARVTDVLGGRAPLPRPSSPDAELRQLVEQAAGELLIRAEGSRIAVVAPDQPGLFCQLAGVLALRGFDILAADAWPEPDGMALDVFHVDHAF